VARRLPDSFPYAGNSELRKRPDEVGTTGSRFDLLVDTGDLTVLADVEGPALGVGARVGEYPESLGDRLVGVTQDRVVELQRFGKLAVGLRVVGAGCKVEDVERFEFLAAVPQRLAFQRSATGKGLGKPGDDDGLLTDEIGRSIFFSVGAPHFEGGGLVSDTKRLGAHETSCQCENACEYQSDAHNRPPSRDATSGSRLSDAVL